MKKEFYEIVLSKMINERDMIELDIDNLKGLDIDTDDKSYRFIKLFKKLTELNSNIKIFSGMLPEDIFLSYPHNEEK